jgi:hypothetical protein
MVGRGKQRLVRMGPTFWFFRALRSLQTALIPSFSHERCAGLVDYHAWRSREKEGGACLTHNAIVK